MDWVPPSIPPPLGSGQLRVIQANTESKPPVASAGRVPSTGSVDLERPRIGTCMHRPRFTNKVKPYLWGGKSISAIRPPRTR